MALGLHYAVVSVYVCTICGRNLCIMCYLYVYISVICLPAEINFDMLRPLWDKINDFKKYGSISQRHKIRI